jgi:hypothetical protein
MDRFDEPENESRVSDEICSCCNPQFDAILDGGKSGEPWEPSSDVLEAELPIEIREALGSFLGERSINTLKDWVSEIRQRTGGGSISIEDLCHSTSDTEHWGEVNGERYHFICFYDAVILAAMTDEPVDIRTKSPDGTVITATALGSDELRVTPEESVFSFGIDPSVLGNENGDPSLGDVYAAVCPFVKAFPSRLTYEGWRNQVPAATVALPLSGATELAAALVD